MKMSDIRNLPNDEVLSELDKVRQKIFKMRFQGKGTSVENPGGLRALKKDVARMLTTLRERGIAKKAKKN